MSRYLVELTRAPGVVRVSRNGEVFQLWTKRKLRKSSDCAEPTHRGELVKGAVAYGPVGNQLYRAERICDKCIQFLGTFGRERV